MYEFITNKNPTHFTQTTDNSPPIGMYGINYRSSADRISVVHRFVCFVYATKNTLRITLSACVYVWHNRFVCVFLSIHIWLFDRFENIHWTYDGIWIPDSLGICIKRWSVCPTYDAWLRRRTTAEDDQRKSQPARCYAYLLLDNTYRMLMCLTPLGLEV